MKEMRRIVLVGSVLCAVLAVTLALGLNHVFAQETGAGAKAKTELSTANASYYGALVIAAALVGGLGCIGGGYAVGHVGAAALGAASERPEMLFRSLIFVALGEGIAILGLAVGMWLILRLPA